MQDYLIHFAKGLDPNSGSKLPNWPRYDLVKRATLQLNDGPVPINTTTDTFRADGVNKLIQLELQKV
jgi:carboxylesterase type B